MFYDRIAVMDQGRVVEMGSPKELFQTAGGAFRDLCLQGGIALKDFR